MSFRKMIDVELKNKFITLRNGESMTYGGNQMLSASKNVRICGCGAVCALDMFIYLSGSDSLPESTVPKELRVPDIIPLADYDKELIKLSRSYIPLIPKRGINGIVLAAGLNAYFLAHKMPYIAYWGLLKGRIWEETENMLRNNIPVILSVGPNFPKLWGKKKLTFFSLSGGVMRASAQTLAHYVTVTGIGQDYIRISSWGRELYISKKEYEEYVFSESSSIVSNIMYIKRLKRDGSPKMS